ncbi:hypothetical protein A6A04_08360 [Paramagnetospirillum marisnigri]|uniref:Hemerythrin-like domain-containing protein n=1 Tax=Paramagnetospirillum marisnigri TaxID=1285242 RepID=A0A178M8F7_9PROT|nr:hemerythrin domain-containing protein [Paramagnetospirillum marisnigri]OAN44816.1 hypothetical protein A6A04_08360 [Paramagnetospirillum marisnigri]
MTIWNQTDWQSGNPDMDAEHRKLNQMVASLNAVVANDSGIGLDVEAADILHERMRLHFQLEESSARKSDSEAAAILHEDHARLLGLLTQIRAAMAKGDKAAAKDQLRSFNSELAKHDAEIDIPLFRMISKARDPLT